MREVNHFARPGNFLWQRSFWPTPDPVIVLPHIFVTARRAAIISGVHRHGIENEMPVVGVPVAQPLSIDYVVWKCAPKSRRESFECLGIRAAGTTARSSAQATRVRWIIVWP